MEKYGLEFEISPEEFKTMAPQERKRHIRTILKLILHKNGKYGITVPQIMKIASFDSRTISKHLEYLIAIREAYKMDLGGNIALYYPNGIIMHSHDVDEKIGNKYYSFSFIKNQTGEFLYIQEKSKDQFNTFAVKGGLVIEKSKVSQFIEKLEEVYREVSE